MQWRIGRVPFLLNLWAERIGDDGFENLFREMIEAKTSSTHGFLRLFRKNHGLDLENVGGFTQIVLISVILG